MTDNNHPITPPPEMAEKYMEEMLSVYDIVTQAARWGADQELEWCVSYVDNNVSGNKARALRASRRPKPPSLKEQALAELNLTADPEGAELSRTQVELIRRALEALPD